MIKKAEIKITTKDNHKLTVIIQIKNDGGLFDEMKDGFGPYVHDGDRIESIYFWEEENL